MILNSVIFIGSPNLMCSFQKSVSSLELFFQTEILTFIGNTIRMQNFPVMIVNHLFRLNHQELSKLAKISSLMNESGK